MIPVLSATAIAVFLAAAVSDAARRRIPNELVVALILVALARIGIELAAGTGFGRPAADLAVGLAVFVAGAVAFQLRLLGGGDVKLLAAGALWVGALAAGPYLMATVLAGGVLGLGYLLWILARRQRDAAARPSLPYGLAIAAGGVLTTLGAV
jgi:prepilin peptidase CpaA